MTTPPLPSQVFAQRLQEVREQKGWSQDQLAQFCSDRLGHPINRATIGQIEQGHHVRSRRVTLNEVVLICYALGVPLTGMIFPLHDETPVRVTPTEPLSAKSARRWAVGTQAFSDPTIYQANTPTAGSEPVTWPPMADLLRLVTDIAEHHPSGPKGTQQEQGFAVQQMRLGLEVLKSKVSALESQLRWIEQGLIRDGMPPMPPAAEAAADPITANHPTAASRRQRRGPTE